MILDIDGCRRETLQEELGEAFLDRASPEPFSRQLALFGERARAADPSEPVIFDRSPLDFLAYLRATDQRRPGSSRWDLPEDVVDCARAALGRGDLAAPLRPSPGAQAARGRTPSLRTLVGRYLAELVLEDALGSLAGEGSPSVAELSGPTPRRLRQRLRVSPPPSAGRVAPPAP